MPTYDTDYLIAQVKRRASIPTSQSLFTNDKLILMLNDELKTRIVPTLMSLVDEWFLTYEDTATDGVTTIYPIPSEAVGNKLRNITIWENSKQIRTIPRLNYSDLQNSIFGFYVENNNIIMYPNAIEANKVLRMSYFKRVDDIVSMSESGYISVVSGNDITISTTLPTTFILNAEIQIVNNKNPFNILWSGTISNIVGSVITLDSTPTSVNVGNYLCLKGETVFPFIPIEMYPLLCQSVVVKCLEAIGDDNGLNMASNVLQQIEFNCKQTLSPRIDGNPKKIISNNSIGRYII